MRATRDDAGEGGLGGGRALAVEAAPAKINLALHVTGQRADGYHLIDSLVVFAGIGDVVRAETGEEEVELALRGPFADDLAESGPIEENLVFLAADLLAASRRGMRPATRLILDKRLPIASGMGGGSADAAATLRLLDRYWKLQTAPDKLSKLALELGADVPMCLASHPLLARGIGEKLTPVDGLPALPLVLINPGIQVSTQEVFGRLGAEFDAPLPPLPSQFRSVFELVIWLRRTTNGLEEAAKAEAKVIGRALRALSSDPDCMLARMTGSGATCFGVFASQAAAQRAAVRLRISRPDWWITATLAGAS